MMELPIWKVKKLLWHFFCRSLNFMIYLLGLITSLLCFYWLFHFEFWSERLIYIIITLIIFIVVTGLVLRLTKAEKD